MVFVILLPTACVSLLATGCASVPSEQEPDQAIPDEGAKTGTYLRYYSRASIAGTPYFGLNIGDPSMSYRARLGETEQGFKLLRFEERPAGPAENARVVSVLTLEKDGKQIVLVRDQPYYKHGVRIGQRLDGIAHHAAIGHQLEIRGHRFTVTGFDAASNTAVLRRTRDSREWTIGVDTSTTDSVASQH